MVKTLGSRSAASAGEALSFFRARKKNPLGVINRHLNMAFG
jgi:hypothetical protein